MDLDEFGPSTFTKRTRASSHKHTTSQGIMGVFFHRSGPVAQLGARFHGMEELAGFLTACSYVKPGRSIHEVETKSVKKKLKDKAFARNVNRDDIVNGATEMGVDLDEHIDCCIRAMQARAEELGLAGTSTASA